MYDKEFECAKNARLNSYSPYSNFKVGAVLKCKNGKLYLGCNIENNGIQSICAERVAFVKALSDGEREFDRIFVVGGSEEISDECMPCGYCRQFMNEFVDDDFKVVTLDHGKIKEYSMDEILPFSFKL